MIDENNHLMKYFESSERIATYSILWYVEFYRGEIELASVEKKILIFMDKFIASRHIFQ